MEEDRISDSARAYLLKEFGGIGEFAKQMGKHDPSVLDAWIHFRSAVFNDSSDGLPKKYRELISMAIEVSSGRPSGKAGERHARLAVRAGATLHEVFETSMLCEFFAGSTNYVDYGIAAVRAAEDEEQKQKEATRGA